MSIDCYQLSEYVIKPALSCLGLGGDDAAHLLLLTCAQETQLGKYLVQAKINFSGGIGIYQMQAPTFHYIWDNQVAPYAAVRAKIKLYIGYDNKPAIQRLATDLSLATIMARLFYHRVEEPLPNCNDMKAVATYYKKYWNTERGKATVEEAMANYVLYVSDAKDN